MKKISDDTRIVKVYDSTLRDGAQGEGISFSLEDKLLIAEKLDDIGIQYIEGGFPNPTNPKDLEFFRHIKSLKLTNSQIVAFGSTRRASNKPEHDPGLRALLDADTEIITIFGKSWGLHVRDVLRISLNENLRLIEDSVRFLVSEGRRVFFDAEHFFNGYETDAHYALNTLKAAQDGGAEICILCDTNGGMIPDDIRVACKKVSQSIQIPFGIHCHNDSGLSSANTLTAV
ncbi:MAG TPA: citramalate synthase, partial [Anaerolineae bacterium]|nr:citramalate synthase [Anaerolineae bacterium]